MNNSKLLDDDFGEEFDPDTVDSLPPSKFIFAIDEANIDPQCPNIVPVVITPVDYYEENACAWYDGHFHISEFDELRDLCDFGNDAESLFCFDKSMMPISDFRNKMLYLGFEEEPYLIGIDSSNDDSDENDDFHDSTQEMLEDLGVDTLAPSDCYYHLTTNGLSFIVAIVPKKYFEENGCMYDGHIWFVEFNDLSEKYSFSQKMECIYEFDTSKENMAKELDSLGMTTNDEFSKFMNVAAGFEKPEKDKNAGPTKSEILSEKLYEFQKNNPEFFSNRKNDPSSLKEYRTKLYEIIEDVMSFKISDLLSLIASYVEENAGDMANKVQYIAEHNNFENKFYDTKPRMEESIRRGASQPDAWVLNEIIPASNVDGHLLFKFECDFLNGGEDFQGIVCVDENGNVKHHFVQTKIA